METIYLPHHESPIAEIETEAFLDALKAWNSNHLITVEGKKARVTAVYDASGKVIMLTRNSGEISWSIPVTDKKWQETPRDEKYFPNQYLTNPTWRRFEGIAAYKYVNTPWVAETHETQVAEVLGE